MERLGSEEREREIERERHTHTHTPTVGQTSLFLCLYRSYMFLSPSHVSLSLSCVESIYIRGRQSERENGGTLSDSLSLSLSPSLSLLRLWFSLASFLISLSSLSVSFFCSLLLCHNINTFHIQGTSTFLVPKIMEL